jgi:hypothetical protein
MKVPHNHPIETTNLLGATTMNFQANQAITLIKTNIINDKKLIGKKGVVDFQCKDGMVWVKLGRSSRCVPPEFIQAI